VGANGAGKSSVLEALAMLKQSLEQGTAGPALAENGRLVELGSFRQFIYRNETSRLLTYELGLGAEGDKSDRLHCEAAFAYSIRRKNIYLRSFQIGEAGETPWLSASADNAGRVDHVQTTEPGETSETLRILGRVERSSWLMRVTPAWDRWGAEAGRPITECAHSPAFYDRCTAGVTAIERLFGDLVHLSSDRAPVSVVFPITSQLLPDVGARGENAAALLHAHRYADEAAPGVRFVAGWLERLGVGRHLRVIPIEEHLYEVTIEEMETDRVMGLGDAGHAARQLFPMLVQAYLAHPRATLLLEEPEAHLHPRLQNELADLFIDLIRGGRRMLVETYSEALLSRLQQRIREGSLPPDDLGVYLVQKADGDTQFSELPVEADGSLRDWPGDFWAGLGSGTLPAGERERGARRRRGDAA
jgi:hypothetical protein